MDKIFLGVPQGSKSDALLSIIYICDLFILVTDTDIADFADNTTPYFSGDKISPVVASLERSANLMFNWFTDKKMKGNKDKCHVLLCTNETLQVKIGAALIANNKREELVGVKIDDKLMFDEHIRNIFKKGSAKLNALSRVAKHICRKKRRLIMNAFFSAQFSFCSLIWMFHNRF